MNLGNQSVFAGRPRSAQRLLREGVVLLADGPADLAMLGFMLDALVEANALTGRLAEATAVLARLDTEVLPRLRHPLRGRGAPWLAAARGEVDQACRLLATAVVEAEASGADLERVHALHDLTRLGRPRAGDLVAVARTVDGPAVAAWSAQANAVAAGDAAGVDAVVPAAPLTPREREVARLAADGMTDREIAVRLTLSQRTVHSHLHRPTPSSASPGERTCGARHGDRLAAARPPARAEAADGGADARSGRGTGGDRTRGRLQDPCRRHSHPVSRRYRPSRRMSPAT